MKRLMASYANNPVDNTVLTLLYAYGKALCSSLRIGSGRGSYYIQFYSWRGSLIVGEVNCVGDNATFIWMQWRVNKEKLYLPFTLSHSHLRGLDLVKRSFLRRQYLSIHLHVFPRKENANSD